MLFLAVLSLYDISSQHGALVRNESIAADLTSLPVAGGSTSLGRLIELNLAGAVVGGQLTVPRDGED